MINLAYSRFIKLAIGRNNQNMHITYYASLHYVLNIILTSVTYGNATTPASIALTGTTITTS